MPKTTTSRKVSLAPPRTDETDARSRRARAERMAVTPLGGGVYEVDSESGHTYFVDLPGSRCTCPDHMYRGARCKHLRRVAIEVDEGRVPPPGKMAVDCAVCDTTLFVDERDDGPYCCEHCELSPGETVVDAESDDLLVVVRTTDRRADEVQVPGHDCTVAAYPKNERYPGDDPVVEALYPLPSGMESDDVRPYHLRPYSFPISRLERPRR